jgi:hypothetical protein
VRKQTFLLSYRCGRRSYVFALLMQKQASPGRS